MRLLAAGLVAAFCAVALMAAPPCPDLPGAEAALDTGRRFVMIGEGHGTTEIPVLFGDLVCHAAQRGPVAVALEYRFHAQPGMDAYMASNGSPAARAAFLDWVIWDRRGRTGATASPCST